MIYFLLLVSRQGKTRLVRWYQHLGDNENGGGGGGGSRSNGVTLKEKNELLREASQKVLARTAKQCNVVEWRNDAKLIYKRYASLFFIACVDNKENPLLILEVIHHFVEVLDKYFGNVCELDLIFNFHKAHYLLDEIICGGEFQESSKKAILRAMNAQDVLTEESSSQKSNIPKF